MATVSTLRIAPVKGLSSITRDRVTITRSGVPEDRRAFLIDAAGSVVTLRSHPHLVQVAPHLDLAAGSLSLRFPDGATVTSPLEPAGEAVRAQLYGKDRHGRVLTGDVADALSAFAGAPLRVVVGATGVGWDEGPVSILGRASADAVGGEQRDRARYRMLIELEGTAPFEEEGWVGATLRIGEAQVRVDHPLVRCVIITQSPATGDKDWDGLHVLAERRGADHLCLGVIAEVVTPGDVWVGAEATLDALAAS